MLTDGYAAFYDGDEAKTWTVLPAATVAFYANYDGADPATSTQAVKKEVETALNANKFTAPQSDGVFVGWNTQANGLGTAYADGASVTLTNDIALYAQWTTMPTGLTANCGQTLANVQLPDKWAWVDSTASVGNVGTNAFPATFIDGSNRVTLACPLR